MRPRAPFQWYGSKGNLYARLRPFLAVERGIYCEPFAGSAICLFARPPAPVEFLNDLDGDIINLYRVLQDPVLFLKLQHRLRYTLYSEAEFCRAIALAQQPNLSPLLRAWAFYVRQGQGFGGMIPTTRGHWGRVLRSSHRGCAGTCSGWLSRTFLLGEFHRRLQRVQLWQTDGIKCIRYCDSPDTLFYIDPPYPHATRVAIHRNRYHHEMSDEQHRELVEVLCNLQGSAVISSYPGPLYEPLLKAGYGKDLIKTACHAAVRGRNSGLQGEGAAMLKVPRTEVIWSRYRGAIKRL